MHISAWNEAGVKRCVINVAVPFKFLQGEREHAWLTIPLDRKSCLSFQDAFAVGQVRRFGFPMVTAAISCPSAIIRSITCGAFFAKLDVQKNVPFTPHSLRQSRMRLVPMTETSMPSLSVSHRTPCSRGTSNSSVSKLSATIFGKQRYSFRFLFFISLRQNNQT